jgi:hypothetical protein
MPKKRIVVTSRGVRLDMDALKASQPNAKPIVAGRLKDAADRPAPKNVVVQTHPPRINATVPAPRPVQIAAPEVVEEVVVHHNKKKKGNDND